MTYQNQSEYQNQTRPFYGNGWENGPTSPDYKQEVKGETWEHYYKKMGFDDL